MRVLVMEAMDKNSVQQRMFTVGVHLYGLDS